MAVDSGDASSVLGFYAKVMTLKEGESRSNIRMSPISCKIVDEEPMLDELAAFLVDVDLDVYSPDNWKMRKDSRVQDSPDASSILLFFSKYSTVPDAQKATADRQALWNIAVYGREEKMNEALLPYKG